MSNSLNHPYGVKPLGNMYLDHGYDYSSSLQSPRSIGLGKFCILSDEIINDILTFLSGEKLCQCSNLSRVFYVFSNTNELWRDIYLRQCNGININFHKNWKNSFINHFFHSKYISDKPIVINNLYSNFLHRSYACASYDLELQCPGIMSNNNIEIIDNCYENLSVNDFIEKYEKPNIPVVLKNAIKNWSSYQNWSEDYLINKCDNFKFRTTSATCATNALFTMKEYFQYVNNSKNSSYEEAPLYLFERNFLKCKNANFSNDFEILKYFSHKNTDLFKLFGENERPDYHWLISGPAKSGSIFHIDPNCTNAW